MKRRNRQRPNDTIGVMILLDGGGYQPADADAIATHLNGLLATLGIEVGCTHRFAILGTEIKYLPDFDAAMGFQDAGLAARARIAGDGESSNRQMPTA